MSIEEDTNAGVESKGEALGLEGNLFFYVVFALLVSIFLFAYCAETGMSLFQTIMWVVLPWPLTFAYLYAFEINKPPSYRNDIIQKAAGDTYITHTDKDNKYYKEGSYHLEVEGEGEDS